MQPERGGACQSSCRTASRHPVAAPCNMGAGMQPVTRHCNDQHCVCVCAGWVTAGDAPQGPDQPPHPEAGLLQVGAGPSLFPAAVLVAQGCGHSTSGRQQDIRSLSPHHPQASSAARLTQGCCYRIVSCIVPRSGASLATGRLSCATGCCSMRHFCSSTGLHSSAAPSR